MAKFELFSKELTDRQIVYRIFGIKFSVKNKEVQASKIIQDLLDLSKLKAAKRLVVFLTPSECKLNGGIMSIFSLCTFSRKIPTVDFCTLATFPGKVTYVINDKFENGEKVLRFEQIVKNANNVQELILHIPEYYADDFYNELKKEDIKFLKSIPNLHINILNQNIELMPEPEKLKDLYKLTSNITQTIAHDRYATQAVCNKWQIPTHLFSVNIDLSNYKSYPFENKEKTIVLSPDFNENRARIVEKLQKELPDWKLITVNNLTFAQYMDLISRAPFTITFGEGMDGYFCQPQPVNSIGFAVYNESFFPSENWKNFKNVYLSFDDMYNNIVCDIKKYIEDKELFNSVIEEFMAECAKYYQIPKFEDNLKRFYEGKYDFLTKDKNNENIR